MKNSVVKIILEMLLPYYCRGCGRTGSLLCEDCRAKIEIIGRISGRAASRKTGTSGEEAKASGGEEARVVGDGEKTRAAGGKEIERGDLEALFVGGFREGALEKLVKDYKFRSVKKISEILVSILDEAVPRDFSAGEEVVVVPLPTIRKHIRERGFDHTKRLAREFAERRGLECREILRRVNKTVQVGADEEAREKQAEGAYAVDKLWPGKVYLLIDDVWTTGASMRAAAKRLREAGAGKIYGATVEIGK